VSIIPCPGGSSVQFLTFLTIRKALYDWVAIMTEESREFRKLRRMERYDRWKREIGHNALLFGVAVLIMIVVIYFLTRQRR
jgi:hypothetical protein